MAWPQNRRGLLRDSREGYRRKRRATASRGRCPSAPDDRGNSIGSNVVAGHYTDFGFNSYLNTGPNNTGVPDDITFTRGQKDGEPDLYFFNFGTYSGKFYFNDEKPVAGESYLDNVRDEVLF